MKGVDKSKKCFRLVGGVLCERTVGDVLPALIQNTDQVTIKISIKVTEIRTNLIYFSLNFQLTKLISAMNDRLATKGKEINDYKEKHNIRIREQDQEETQQAEEESNESKRSAVVVNPVGMD